MMIKVFTADKHGLISLSEKELKELLDEAYWEGYRAHSGTWVYSSPTWHPYTLCSNANGDMTISLSKEAANITASDKTSSDCTIKANNSGITTASNLKITY